ncbi:MULTISPECIES: phosphoenolpyruvate--protein phosphotransferase [unclassified Moraxella]|uniref:phosphoenolpyruvate--protein phosphotransferase n=1 Tax=unclassified Moraxella TaxID=2685852 RepID=UPI003AF9AEED
MVLLDKQAVVMHQSANNKTEALQLLASILVQEKLTTPDYLQGLQDREAQSATYLGQGVAIPHGTPASRDAILQTGVRLVHFPKGLVWDEQGNVVHLAVVIAAKSDEHLQVLQQLTKALRDDVSESIQTANTADEILAILQATPPQLYLHEQLIATSVMATDVDDVLLKATQLLKNHQRVGQGFLAQLSLDTAIELSDGVWSVISSQSVQQPAVSLVSLATPLAFEIAKQSHQLQLLVAIADHPSMDAEALGKLLDVLATPNLLKELAHQDNPTRYLAQRTGATIIPDWTSQSVRLAMPNGLHARPATQLVALTQALTGDVLVKTAQTEYVSAKSLTKLLSLGASFGDTLTLMAEPNTDAEAQLPQLIEAIQQGLGDPIEPLPTVATNALEANSFDGNSLAVTNAPALSDTNATPNKLPIEQLQDNQAYPAIVACRGFAVGQAFVKTQVAFEFAELASSIHSDASQEQAKLADAIDVVKHALQHDIEHATNPNIQAIFTAHLALLDDPELVNPVKTGLQQGLTAPMAWSRHIDKSVAEQSGLSNRLLAERAMDLRDVGDKVLAKLCGVSQSLAPNEPYILIAEDLVPSDVAKLDPSQVLGILTAVGGASSHTAIVARSLGIATLVGAGEAILGITNTSSVLVDAVTGEFIVNPDSERVTHTLSEQAKLAEQQQQALAHALEPAVTQDNHQVEVAVNLGNVHDTAQAVALGAEAVGLLRTELVFMSHSTAPDEASQIQDYQTVFDALAGRPLVVRTLDVGGDKPLPYLPMPAEENPFLGVRGIRMTLRQPQLLRQQLIALIKSANGRPLRIMFPMVGRLEDWQSAKAILDEVLLDYPCPDLQVGIMVEVPSIALLAPILAQEVDFFSIGTNDLTQYTLAIDRGHPVLSSEADGLHPSVLMLIDRTVQSAHTHGKWVGVCGELASDSQAVPILLGLGVDELSISAKQIPLVKAQIRTLNLSDCQQLAKQALASATASQVRALTSATI